MAAIKHVIGSLDHLKTSDQYEVIIYDQDVI
jgi:hypothetical protein